MVRLHASLLELEVERKLVEVSDQISEILHRRQTAMGEIADNTIMYGHSPYLPAESDWLKCISS